MCYPKPEKQIDRVEEEDLITVEESGSMTWHVIQPQL